MTARRMPATVQRKSRERCHLPELRFAFPNIETINPQTDLFLLLKLTTGTKIYELSSECIIQTILLKTHSQIRCYQFWFGQSIYDVRSAMNLFVVGEH